MKSLVQFTLVLFALTFFVDVEAGWKFWKKKDDHDTSSENPVALANSQNLTGNPDARLLGTPIIAPLNPKDTSADVSKQRKPNPGTEVGLDVGLAKPQKPGVGPGGDGYRDWAVELTGAGDPAIRRGSNVSDPNRGNRPISALEPLDHGQHANSGNKAAVTPGTPLGPQGPVAAGGKTVNPVGPTASTQRPTSSVVTLPIQKPPVNLPQLTPTSTTAAAPPSKTWAEIAAGGNSNGRAGSSSIGVPSTTGRPVGGSATGTAFIGGAVLAGPAAAGAAIPSKDGSTINYSANPTYSKGTSVTNDDLEKLSESLFAKDVNNANKYITLNLQKTTSGNSPKDEASQPLLQVKPEALQIPTVQKVLAIYDNYKLDTRENEYISPAQRQEESALVDAFLSTNVMSAAMRFLADKGFVKKDYYEYKDLLRRIWFSLYSRGEGKIGSTGFEHVFLTELKLGTELSGLHNWIYFNAEETKNRLNYLGYIKKIDLGDRAAIAKVHVRFNGIDKPVTNVFIGTSPELEMALYTVCFFARPDTKCPVSLGGAKFNILTYKFKYRGKESVGSAYPDI